MYNKTIFKRCFSYKGKYWFYNIKEIPTYIKQMRFLMKHGYDMYACWETFDWFIHTMRKILTHQRYYYRLRTISASRYLLTYKL